MTATTRRAAASWQSPRFAGNNVDHSSTITAAAVALAALGLGVASSSQGCRINDLATSKCEVKEVSTRQAWKASLNEDDDTEEDELSNNEKILFRTIPVSDLRIQDDDDGKSERAFASAMEKDLFHGYDEDTEELSCDCSEKSSIDENDSAPVSTAVVHKFVSFSAVNAPPAEPGICNRHLLPYGTGKRITFGDFF